MLISRSRLASCSLVALISILAGCDYGPPLPADGADLANIVTTIEQATPSSVTPEEVAEALALGSDATTIQREMLEERLVGTVVAWDIRVFDVAFDGQVYRITSQAIPIRNPGALNLVRVVVFVQPRTDADHEHLRSVQTDDVIHIRGVVQNILLRTVVSIGPAILLAGVGGPVGPGDAHAVAGSATEGSKP